jgi:predicted DNA-binding protein (MmcQ/YjbR family)
MNKKYWNSVYDDGSVTDQQIYQWIDDSYNLVVDKLSKVKKVELANLP